MEIEATTAEIEWFETSGYGFCVIVNDSMSMLSEAE
jgi:hypothetical protein